MIFVEAKEKNSLVLYHDWLGAFETLSAEESKQLIIANIKYSMSDADPEQRSAGFNMAWQFIKPTLQRDKESYLEKCKKNAENGAKGGRPKKEKAEKENQIKTEKTERFSKKAKKADNDNDNDSDNDSDSDNECVEIYTHTHGTFNNVFLTDKEYQQLKTDYQNIADDIINQLSENIKAGKENGITGHIGRLYAYARNYKPKKETEHKPSYDIDKALEASRNIDPTKTKRETPPQ